MRIEQKLAALVAVQSLQVGVQRQAQNAFRRCPRFARARGGRVGRRRHDPTSGLCREKGSEYSVASQHAPASSERCEPGPDVRSTSAESAVPTAVPCPPWTAAPRRRLLDEQIGAKSAPARLERPRVPALPARRRSCFHQIAGLLPRPSHTYADGRYPCQHTLRGARIRGFEALPARCVYSSGHRCLRPSQPDPLASSSDMLRLSNYTAEGEPLRPSCGFDRMNPSARHKTTLRLAGFAAPEFISGLFAHH